MRFGQPAGGRGRDAPRSPGCPPRPPGVPHPAGRSGPPRPDRRAAPSCQQWSAAPGRPGIAHCAQPAGCCQPAVPRTVAGRRPLPEPRPGGRPRRVSPQSHPPAATSASIGHSIVTPLPTAPPSSRVVYGATPAAGHPPRATSRIDRPSHPFRRRRTPSGAAAPAVRGAPAPARVRQPDGRASPRPDGDRQHRTRRLELTGRPWARNRPAERPGTWRSSVPDPQ